MKAEYLIFNLMVALPPLLLALLPGAGFRDRFAAAGVAITALAVPFLVWDAWVAGAHWHFNPRYVLGPTLAGLPVEEVLFFVTVPFACLFSWHAALRERGATPRRALRFVYLLIPVAAVAGVVFLAQGRGYTGLTALALAIVMTLDRSSARLLEQPRTFVYAGFVMAVTLVFNGYLTARPVVLYVAETQLDWRIFTIPIEDFGYGWALVLGVTVMYENQLAKRSAPEGRRKGIVNRAIERRFGGYRQIVNTVDPTLPLEPSERRSVAVVGAGLAGLSAATTLAERGYAVTLHEREDHLGGKVGAWQTEMASGERVGVEHGFHAFFRHYYNLHNLLERIGASPRLVPIDDYLILSRDGREYSFHGVSTTPLVNLFSMARHGVYRLRDIAFGPAGQEMAAFMEYDPDRTFADFDDESLADFAERAQLPASLQLVFHTFARAFFADHDKLSMAELIKSFHSYYLSHDHGIVYDYLDGDYGDALLEPFRRHLEKHGARIERGREIARIERLAGGGFSVAGEPVDAVVLATDAGGARAILEASPDLLAEDPALAAKLPHLRTGQRYAMLRLWLDRDIERPLPVFVITEKIRALDSISIYHRIERESTEWVERHGGGIFELHCYAVPDDLADEDIRDQFLAELHHWLPELRSAEIRHEVLQIRSDFAAFHVGMAKERPGYRTGVPGLLLAGDWVRLPVPAMLMEAACTAGLLCANAVLERDGLRQEPVESVPLRGLFAQAPRLGGGGRPRSGAETSRAERVAR